MTKALNLDKKELPFYIENYQEYWGTLKHKAGKILIEAGDVPKKIYYVQSGIIRVFICNGKQETTYRFFSSNDIIIPYRNFISGDNPAILNLECITQSVVTAINIDTWKELELTDQKLKDFRNQTIITEFDKLVVRCSDLAALDATTHYKKLLKEYPYLMEGC